MNGFGRREPFGMFRGGIGCGQGLLTTPKVLLHVSQLTELQIQLLYNLSVT